MFENDIDAAIFWNYFLVIGIGDYSVTYLQIDLPNANLISDINPSKTRSSVNQLS